MKNKLLNVVLGSTALGLSMTSAGAFASQGTFGLHAGWGIPGEGATGGFALGAQGDFALTPDVSVGGYLTYQILGLEDAPDDQSLSQIPIGVTANWNVMGGPGFYLGANLGMVMSTRSDGEDSVNESDFSVGGQVGFDFPINDMMSAGVEGRYMAILADETARLININAHLKFAF